jgi:asparagine synthetase B (glutamine-hydrolysing)
MLIEGNGGDDCFGFADLATQSKMIFKSRFPSIFKLMTASLFKNSSTWKLETESRFLARLLALSDVHEINYLNYFLALTPVNFLGLNVYKTWDQQLNEVMEGVFSNLVENSNKLSYQANVTIRQLMHVNSRRWAAKANSVGENLGIRIIYPYIWRDILLEQGNIPWQAKINKGVVKWPLKRLLEEYMPNNFIYRKKSGFVPPFKQWLISESFNHMVRDILLASDSNITRIVPSQIIKDLLSDALEGKNLRHAILNFLWGSIFTEMWIKKQKSDNID